MKYVYTILILGIIAVLAFTFLSDGNSRQDEVRTVGQEKLALWSPAFEHNGMIPRKYTCDGEGDTNPPLTISNIPSDTRTLALIMEDPDIPEEIKKERGIETFEHWAVYGIPSGVTEIPEGEVIGALGMNGRGEAGYTGPCPPTEYHPTEHRYIFKLFALEGSLQFAHTPSKAELLAAMSGMVLDEATLIGKYDRTK